MQQPLTVKPRALLRFRPLQLASRARRFHNHSTAQRPQAVINHVPVRGLSAIRRAPRASEGISPVSEPNDVKKTQEPSWRKHLDTHEKLVSLATFQDVALVDTVLQDEATCHNFEFWNLLLSTRLRLEGHHAVLAILREMARRNVALPSRDDHALQFWDTVLEAAVHEEAVTGAVCNDVLQTFKESGKIWEPLYETAMRHALRVNTKNAKTWHHRLASVGLATQDAYERVINNTIASGSPAVLRRLGYLHQTVPPGTYNIYDFIVPHIHSRSLQHRWQALLVSKHDFPSDLSELPQHLQRRAQELQKQQPKKELPGSNLPQDILNLPENTSEGIADESEPPMTKREVVDFIDSVRGFKPRGLSDDMTARAFATTAFSVNAIIHAVNSFGLQVLGPQAMREMCIRCSGPEDVWQKLTLLEEKKVKIHPCVYNKLIYLCAEGNRADVLESTLACDLHPETFEDKETLLKLLREDLERENVAQTYRNLVVLTVFHNVKAATIWNRLLCLELGKGPSRVRAIVDDMIDNGIPVSRYSIKSIFFAVARIRNRQGGYKTYWSGRKGLRTGPSKTNFDDLRFLTRLFVDATRVRSVIPPEFWQGLLKFYGMEGRLMEMEKLAMWLSVQYPPRTVMVNRKSFFTRSGRHTPTERRYEGIFNADMQDAFIEWGFKTIGHWLPWGQLSLGFTAPQLSGNFNRLRSNELSILRWWDRGLLLCRELQKRGFETDVRRVRKVVVHRFRILFGEETSTRIENRHSRDRNFITLKEMVNRVNEIWQGRIFPFDLNVPDEELARRVFDEDPATYMRASRHKYEDALLLQQVAEDGGELHKAYGEVGLVGRSGRSKWRLLRQLQRLTAEREASPSTAQIDQVWDENKEDQGAGAVEAGEATMQIWR